MAQPGTRLPERVDRDRNHDYRDAWIRDQAFAGIAAARAGALDLLDAAAGFAATRLLDDGPELKPAYTVAGGRDQLGGSSTSTGSGTTSARSATPRERSCSAGSSWRWPSTSKATSWLRPLL